MGGLHLPNRLEYLVTRDFAYLRDTINVEAQMTMSYFYTTE